MQRSVIEYLDSAAAAFGGSPRPWMTAGNPFATPISAPPSGAWGPPSRR